ncbi:hypothetical protein Fcan01_12373 [Folsomia candida]|uniref:Uncharacterized protein n=1 Tax=Folsomia candida TaxID=158441 RepID=A0A226E6S5_FOLCA|nr:hypothetical protein Fcan01_12373 [Folsomia candida]
MILTMDENDDEWLIDLQKNWPLQWDKFVRDVMVHARWDNSSSSRSPDKSLTQKLKHRVEKCSLLGGRGNEFSHGNDNDDEQQQRSYRRHPSSNLGGSSLRHHAHLLLKCCLLILRHLVHFSPGCDTPL